MLKRLEKMVEQGRLDASVLDQVRKATSPDVHHVQSEALMSSICKPANPACRLQPMSLQLRWSCVLDLGMCFLSTTELLRRKQRLFAKRGVPAGVEVSPGVFKDVPGETKQREDFVYAHAPGTMPRECAAGRRNCRWL
jgi:hypothetical protein